MIYSSPKRITIFGRPGSGKSTFALKLHKALALPLYHLDKYFYESHWVERDYDQFLAIQKELVDQDVWIIDGNSLKSLEMRFARADVILYLHLPRWLCMFRIFKRFWKKDPTMDDRAPFCSEKVSFKLLHYAWTFEKRAALHLSRLRNLYPHVAFYDIQNEKEMKTMLEKLIKKAKNSEDLHAHFF